MQLTEDRIGMTEAESMAVDRLVGDKQASLTRNENGSLLIQIGDEIHEVAADGTVT